MGFVTKPKSEWLWLFQYQGQQSVAERERRAKAGQKCEFIEREF